MSLVIVNPFNQIIKFVEKFVAESDFASEYLKLIFSYLSTSNQSSQIDTNSDYDMFLEKEKEVLASLEFDRDIHEYNEKIIENYIDEFLSRYSIDNDISENNLTNKKTNFRNFIKNHFMITAYVEEKFLSFIKHIFNNSNSIILIFESEISRSLFYILAYYLNLSLLQESQFKFKSILEDVSKNVLFDDMFISAHKSHMPYIFMFENVRKVAQLAREFEIIKLNYASELDSSFADYVYLVFNNLLFSSKEKVYSDYKHKNLSEIYSQKMPIDLIIETLMQANYFIKFAFENHAEASLNENNNIKRFIELNKITRNKFFNSKQKNVLYFFMEDNSPKIYRKRLLALSNEKIKYTPFISREGINEDLFDFLYGKKIDVLLQRAPYFYLESEEKKNLCLGLEDYISTRNKFSLKMSSFAMVEKLFFRYNCYLFIKNFVDSKYQEVMGKFNLKIDVPFSIPYSIDNDKLKILNAPITEAEIQNTLDCITAEILVRMKQENLDFPVIIKPDQCEVHKMFLILSESGIKKFVNVNNLKMLVNNKHFLVQKMIKHDGLMFKNFFINKKSYTFIRPSLPNLEGKNLEIAHFKDNCFTFKNEFLYNKEDDSFWNSIENFQEEKLLADVNYQLIDYISTHFAHQMDINLFGLDYLYDKETKTYYILECNYFPSYRELKEKLSNEFTEHIFGYHNDLLNIK